jgi:ATP-dependent helicase IRC3
MPASQQQKDFVAKRWGKTKLMLQSDSESESQAKRIAEMTKGEAANIITRLKHGAQSRYARAMKTAVRSDKASAKEALRRSREDVRIGPLLS